MANGKGFSCVWSLYISILIVCYKSLPVISDGVPSAVNQSFYKTQVVRRTDFPKDFMFGCSTSALQTEGAGDEGGRGPSTWDPFIQDGIGGRDIAVDSYHRYKEDVQLLKNMGVDVYRFSISWSRLLPDGTINGGINQVGIDFYNDLINDLLKNGITPFVTLFHFDLPQKLQDMYKGFLNRQIVDDFKAYADLCFKTYGDRVKHWVTINEPQVFGEFGYRLGLKDPNANPVTDPFLATHNIILSHAAATKVYKEKYQEIQKGVIGISLATQWFKPLTESIQDADAAQRAFDFLVGWVLEPLVFGDYPFIMKALVGNGLPIFTNEEKALIKGAFDFIGCNYYTSRYAASLSFNTNDNITSAGQFERVNITVNNIKGKPIGEKAPGSDQVYIYPEGLRDALVYIMEHYENPVLYIIENGYPEKRNDSIPLNVALKDNGRIHNIINHLNAVKEALNKGANVKTYIMWSLMDCMEMGSGYQVRYGLNYIDYLNNLKRIPKKSAKWIRSWLKSPSK